MVASYEMEVKGFVPGQNGLLARLVEVTIERNVSVQEEPWVFYLPVKNVHEYPKGTHIFVHDTRSHGKILTNEKGDVLKILT